MYYDVKLVLKKVPEIKLAIVPLGTKMDASLPKNSATLCSNSKQKQRIIKKDLTCFMLK